MSSLDPSFMKNNRAATERIRRLVASTRDDEMGTRVGEHWTISIALAHLAFWDRRVLLILDATEQAGYLTSEQISVTVNDISLPLWALIPAREAARIAVETAEALDARMEAFPPALLEAVYDANPRWILRDMHRNEHLEELEAALKARRGAGA